MERKHCDLVDLDVPVTCPAGEKITETLEGPGCRCRIEGSSILAARDATSLQVYCTGAHELCPTWRLARETEWQHASVVAIAEPSGERRSFALEDIEELNERAASGDAAGVERMRARISEVRRG